MLNKNITIEWVQIPVHKFLDDQKKFLTDAGIICWGFHNILDHDKKCAENFLNKLNILYEKISERYYIIQHLSDKIAWKQEVAIWMWKLLQDIWGMKQLCKEQIRGVVN